MDKTSQWNYKKYELNLMKMKRWRLQHTDGIEVIHSYVAL